MSEPLPLPETWSRQLREAWSARAATGGSSVPPDLPSFDAPVEVWRERDAAQNSALETVAEERLALWGLEQESSMAGGIEVRWIRPAAGERSGRLIVDLRAGLGLGTAMGILTAAPVVAASGIPAITVGYRHEPYVRHPGAINDVLAVYSTLVAERDPTSIAILGTSLGGHLASQVVAAIGERGVAVPGALVLLWSGIAGRPFPSGVTGDSRFWVRAEPTGERNDFDALMHKLAWFLDGVAPGDPTAYPLDHPRALEAFPPTYFLSGTRAHDLSPVLVSRSRLRAVGVETELDVVEGGWHGFSLEPGIPESDEANRAIASWLHRVLSVNSAD